MRGGPRRVASHRPACGLRAVARGKLLPQHAHLCECILCTWQCTPRAHNTNAHGLTSMCGGDAGRTGAWPAHWTVWCVVCGCAAGAGRLAPGQYAGGRVQRATRRWRASHDRSVRGESACSVCRKVRGAVHVRGERLGAVCGRGVCAHERCMCCCWCVVEWSRGCSSDGRALA